MPSSCPHCSSDKLRIIGRRMTHPVPSLAQLFGLFFVICFGESRRRIYLCEDCGKTTDSHTVLSMAFLILFVIMVVFLVATHLFMLIMMAYFALFY